MFDNLRNMSDGPSYTETPDLETSVQPKRKAPERRVMGMTAGQRLVLSILLLFTSIVMGAMCLLVFQKVWIV
jgi:hypothetical protein